MADNIALSDLLNEEDKKELVLPNFQRSFVWSRKDQQRLVASFISNLPIGNILKVKGGPNDFASRRLCFPQADVDAAADCVYLLDGQQRVSTLKAVFTDVFKREEHDDRWDGIHTQLQWRWFVSIKPSNVESIDPFGWRDMKFKDLENFEPADIYDFIEAKQVWKNKEGVWFQPNYNPDADDGISDAQRRDMVAREAANKNLIPLWEIRKFEGENRARKRNSLHHKSIKFIADRRAVEVRTIAEEDNDKWDIKDVFRGYNEGVIKLYEEGIEENEEQIDEAWRELKADWINSAKTALDGVLENEIVQIELPKDEIHRAIALFEEVNTAGTALDTYDLIVARAARNQDLDNLSNRILGNLNCNVEIDNSIKSEVHNCNIEEIAPSSLGTVSEKLGNAPSNYFKEQFLNLLSIKCHCVEGDSDVEVKHIKKRKQMELSHDQINDNYSEVVFAISKAIIFLIIRCGIRSLGEQEYKLMTLPIAYCFLDDDNWKSSSSVNKIEYWYWSSLFSGSYRENQNESCIRDLKLLSEWIDNDDNPFLSRKNNILEAEDYSDFNTLIGHNEEYSVKKAIRNGIVQYKLSTQPYDLSEENERITSWKNLTDEEYSIHKHHIVPIHNSDTMDESAEAIRSEDNHILNSPLNITPISEEANSNISSLPPSHYLAHIENVASAGHSLPPAAEFAKDDGETEEEYYLRVLNMIYTRIKTSIIDELDMLV
jgi:hypothetical protein